MESSIKERARQDQQAIEKIQTGATQNTPTIGLVGKAVTFDSGGISLKPGSGMHDMKFDKSGGIAVLGAMKAIAQLKPKLKVYGLIPSAENMPVVTPIGITPASRAASISCGASPR